MLSSGNNKHKTNKNKSSSRFKNNKKKADKKFWKLAKNARALVSMQRKTKFAKDAKEKDRSKNTNHIFREKFGNIPRNSKNAIKFKELLRNK